jgi:hypothetical protein
MTADHRPLLVTAARGLKTKIRISVLAALNQRHRTATKLADRIAEIFTL